MGPAAPSSEIPGGIRPQEDGGNSIPEVLIHTVIGVARNKTKQSCLCLYKDESWEKKPWERSRFHLGMAQKLEDRTESFRNCHFPNHGGAFLNHAAKLMG